MFFEFEQTYIAFVNFEQRSITFAIIVVIISSNNSSNIAVIY